MSNDELPPAPPSTSDSLRDADESQDANSPAKSSFATTRPVAVLVVFLAAIVFGYFSYGRLPVRLMPELSYPTLTVRTEYVGAAPEEVEKDISRPIEEALGVISGLRRISSVSRAGVSDVVLEFAWDTSMSDAVQDTLEKLDLVVLPDDAGAYTILRFDPTLDPVMELSLSSTRDVGGPRQAQQQAQQREADLRRLRRLGERQVKRLLEPIKGVAAVRVRGGLEEEIHVMLDAARTSRAGLTISDVLRRLEEENVNIAGGTIKDGRAEYIVRTVNRFQDLEQIRDTVLTLIDGRELRIRDIGAVSLSHRDRQMVTRTAGNSSVQIDIFKEADANIVALAQRIKAAIGTVPRAGSTNDMTTASLGLASDLQASEHARLEVVADRSLFIQSSIDEVRSTAIIGGLLAILVLFLFLGELRSTLIIGVSIPISLLVTFAPLNLLGVSINIMSLGGLALGVGMLVDSSIVVLESIHRCRENGLGPAAATIEGTNDVRGAVVASTLTTIGVFLPMVFVEGVAGQAFGDLGLAVVLSLSVSLIVAIYFIPMLASRQPAKLNAAASPPTIRLVAWRNVWSDVANLGWIGRILLAPYLLFKLFLSSVLELFGQLLLVLIGGPIWLFRRFGGGLIRPLTRGLWWIPLTATNAMLRVSSRAYPQLLRWSLRRARLVLALAAACMAAMYLSARRLDSELLPEVHQGEFTLELALPVGTALEETQAVLEPVERAILESPDEIERLLVQFGFDATSSQRSDEGEHTARFKVLLVPTGEDNAITEQRVADRIRKILARIPDLETRLVRPVLFSFKTPVEVEVYGDDLTHLRAMADRVQQIMARMPMLTDVESSLREGAPEVQLVYDRDRMRRYGLSISDVARRVRDQVRGRSTTRFSRDDRRIPIVVRLGERDRASVIDVKRLIVDPDASGSIPLSSVATVTLGEGPSEIRRIDGERVAVVRANLVSGVSLGATARDIEVQLRKNANWSDRMHFEISGQNQEWERSRASLLLALALSIFLVYVIMAAQFESLLYPLVIMASIPLAFLGTFLALGALHMNISIVVFLGMIMLAGIVVNNAIVLVDYINILKSRGAGLEDAVLEAGKVRLRPILMTTATTVLGLLPMAIGLGDGAEIRRPLAVTVISGLAVSTILTLVVIPVLYVAADKAKARVVSAIGRVDEP